MSAAKLHIDFVPGSRLSGGMTQDDEAPTAAGLIPRIFYLATALLEDAAAEMVEGQESQVDAARVTGLANRLYSVGEELTILADILIVLNGKR